MSLFNQKAMIVYNLNKSVDAEELNSCIQNLKWVECKPTDMSTVGFVSPAFNDDLIFECKGHLLLAIRKEEKILPSNVIKKETQHKVEKLEGEQGRKLKKTEKATIKDEVIYSLLPRAFSKYSTVYIWINTIDHQIVVFTGTSKNAESSLALLRKAIGSLPVTPLKFDSIEMLLTNWVKDNSIPTQLQLNGEAELIAILEEGGIAKFKKQDLISDEILTHIEAGKLVTNLYLKFQDRIDFTINNDFIFKKIKFSEKIIGTNEDIDRKDVSLRFQSDFYLVAEELSKLIKYLSDLFKKTY
ncbi:recombination-associated protein RdgC [Proteus mirabilis]|uniref:recombination-associated protein RdgC n=2 Tax=Proteus mirabilis TaxID=584 RepID=UPI000362E5FB|nr:recombination-associated protein RdgC [Proteus mirabilis]MDM3571464.1 recombination-associated protein RdgC [Proteus mirabilis]